MLKGQLANITSAILYRVFHVGPTVKIIIVKFDDNFHDLTLILNACRSRSLVNDVAYYDCL